MKKEDGVKLCKRSADGKIAYLIKSILKVLQDAVGQLERVEIKERIADLDVRESRAQTNFAHHSSYYLICHQEFREQLTVGC